MESKDKKEIEQALKLGTSKANIHDEYSPRIDNLELTKFLASRPKIETKRRLQLLNILLIFLWSLILFTELFSLLDGLTVETTVTPIITGYIITRLIRFDGNFYLPSSIWGLWGIIALFRGIIASTDQELSDPDFEILIWSILTIYLVIGIVSIILWRLAFPYYKWFTPKKDENGNFRFE